MAHWFIPGGFPEPAPWITFPEPRRVDPNRRYAHWQAGPHAFCQWCSKPADVLYAVPYGTAQDSYAVCTFCAVQTMID